MTKHADQREHQTCEAARQREARLALDRVGAETETIGTSQLARAGQHARDHFSGADAPENDPVEQWGRRIGRILSIIAVLCLAVYLYQTYLG